MCDNCMCGCKKENLSYAEALDAVIHSCDVLIAASGNNQKVTDCANNFVCDLASLRLKAAISRGGD